MNEDGNVSLVDVADLMILRHAVDFDVPQLVKIWIRYDKAQEVFEDES